MTSCLVDAEWLKLLANLRVIAANTNVSYVAITKLAQSPFNLVNRQVRTDEMGFYSLMYLVIKIPTVHFRPTKFETFVRIRFRGFFLILPHPAYSNSQ